MKRGRKLSAAHKAAISAANRHKLSAAHKAKISAANTGKRRTPEAKIRMSLARREMLRRKFGVGLRT